MKWYWDFAAAMAALAFLAGACAAQAGDAEESGKALFRQNCVLCHGESGTGKTPAGTALGAHDLSAREVRKKPDAELELTINQGKNKMPSFGKKLNETQLHELVKYVRSLEKN